MATSFLHSPTTAEELFERPDDGYRYELVEGSPVRMTPTGAEHGVVTARVAYVLQEYALRHGGVCCGAETGFVLRRSPDVVRAPDAAFVAGARIPKTGIPRSYWPFAPDLAVEVPSPSDRASDVQAKIADYFSAGTRLVWIVEPATRTVRVFRSPQDMEVIREGGELSGGDVLPGFRCAVQRLFVA
ncbi:MAG: Uma2 family endonuclease [Acidobacteria bacterium]|nr:Uma2 family endonuclease [Acidobacteriota bacterium]